ncbi:MAG: hypothetical protein RLY30_1864 [Pseudomonadota bacterium]|jgi:squalene synthase HpnC
MASRALSGPTMRNMNDPGLGQALHGGHHYENFPVASWLLPRRMRLPTLALYAFARTGDDLADEGEASTEQRLQGLNELLSGLTRRAQGQGSALQSLGAELALQCEQLGISTTPAEQLIEAFRYDAAFRPFDDWESVHRYCRQSANPVGRLVLAFAGLDRESDTRRAEIERQSDAVCTGLQLANFAQDFGQDLGRNRPTLPRSEWPNAWRWDDHQSRLIQGEALSPSEQLGMTRSLAQRALHLLESARSLPGLLRHARLDGRQRIALEIALTLCGGVAIAQRVLRDPLAPWHASPKLSRWDMALLVPSALALWMTPPRGTSQ